MEVSARIELVKKLKLCNNCLNPGHQLDSCKYNNCKKCSAKHNSLLHIPSEPDSDSSEANCSRDTTTVHHSMASVNLCHKNVLLSTLIVQVADSDGMFHDCRALLDSGSQSNFMSSRFCELLKLKTEKVNLKILGVTKVESVIKSKCQIEYHSKQNAFSALINCLVVPEIGDNLPDKEIQLSIISIPPNIQLADPNFHIPNAIDLLIGADLFWESLCIGQIKLGPSLPILHKTKFGWIVSGPLHDSAFLKNNKLHCNFLKNCDVREQLSRFWETEECSEEKVFSKEEKACELNFISTHTRDEDGRFVVSIPLKEPTERLGDSKAQALNRFLNLERKHQRNQHLRELYVSFMDEYQALGHMTKINDESSSVQIFLPHHGVLKEESLSTKLRVVFDGSFPSSSGWSVNDIQMVGPTIQNDLFNILIRFRQYNYVVSADICKMYRQVLINLSQRCLQQIFWRKNPTQPISTFQLNTVTYGTSSAAFLSIRSLFQLSIENKESYPKASSVIQNDFYVDDLLTGSDSLEELTTTCKELSIILKQGCFVLRKWISNAHQVLDLVQDSTTDLNILRIGSHENTKMLGLLWSSHSDLLMYNINIHKPTGHITKQIILSNIAQIYDPLGLLSPCIVVAKILLQKLWLEKLSWDESVPVDIHTRWIKFQNELSTINNIEIPRNVRCNNPIQTELHTFSDASIDAYGACAYFRCIDTNGISSIHLLCAKSKVAPLKATTVPRLELCGAVIAARLTFKIIKASRMQFHAVYHWSDSTIVLGWINTPSNVLKTFVGNRVAEIQSKTNPQHWCHVGTNENPADFLSRGMNPSLLKTSQLWWHGPPWLSLDSSEWPTLPPENHSKLLELKSSQSFYVNSKIHSIIDFERFSSLSRLKGCAAYCLRFIHNSKNKISKRTGPLSLKELNDASLILAKLSQFQHFSYEYSQLTKEGHMLKKCKIQSLSPFLDDNGIIRVGGRSKNSSLDFKKKHPILLPKNDNFTKLIFRDMHIRLFHAGPNHLLASIREEFWPISGRTIAVHECVRCFRAKPRTGFPLMGDLPRDRITSAFPFHAAGVDYAGPFLLKDREGRGCKTCKAWICLFICLSTKAIHLEISTDMTKDAFIATLRRFISRRGKPAKLFSDNGTNFTGAKNEINDLVNFLKDNENHFTSFCTNESIEWKFIPAYSPHFGGLWEAGVKSMKFHLKRVLGNALLVYEDFQTVLVQVEAILNSRPLHPMSSDPNDLNPITPAHFLIGRPITALPTPDFEDTPEGRLTRFQRLQQLQQHIWRRWSREYLGELQQRQKWSNDQFHVKMGSLVLIKESNNPPLCWRLGRVIALHPGEDNITRVVTLKTQKGVVRRAVATLCPLPVERPAPSIV